MEADRRKAFHAQVRAAEDEVWRRMWAAPYEAVYLCYRETTAERDGALIVVSGEERPEVGAFYVDPRRIPPVERYQLSNWFRWRCERLPILPLEGRAEGVKYVAVKHGFNRIEQGQVSG